MLGGALIGIGAVLMLAGIATLRGWISGKSDWFDASVYDRTGATKSDRMLLYVTFVAMVLTPLLAGAILIGYGLHRLR
jgi:hypothetical protein